MFARPAIVIRVAFARGGPATLILGLALVIGAGHASAATIGVSSSGVSSSWGDPMAWDPEVIPANNGVDTFNVSISDSIILSRQFLPPTHIDSLTVGGSLDILTALVIDLGSASAPGLISIEHSLTLPGETASLSGTIQLTGGALLSGSGGGLLHELSLGGSVSGFGTIRGSISSGATVSASGGTLVVIPEGLGYDNGGGVLQALAPPGEVGILELRDNNYENAGGIIRAGESADVHLRGADITGGTIEAIGSGMIRIPMSGNAYLEDVSMSGTLEIEPLGEAHLYSSIHNTGTWLLNGSGTSGAHIDVETSTILSGGGEIDANASPNSIHGLGILTNLDHQISGRARIDVELHNGSDGVLLADEPYDPVEGTSLSLRTNPKVHDGLASAINGGRLSVVFLEGTNAVSGLGSWRADGGILFGSLSDVHTCGDVTVRDGGLLENASSDLWVDRLQFGPGGRLDAYFDAFFSPSFRIMHSLTNELVDEADWEVSTAVTFEFTGGAPLGTCPSPGSPSFSVIEVAGVDEGDTNSFYSGNFELPNLTIGPGALVLLVDVVDNGNRNGTASLNEALYVRNLVFADGTGEINTNGLNLYYQTLTGNSSQIVPEPSIGTALATAIIGACCLARRRNAHDGRSKTTI